jgi:DNA polymerase-3 subunit delta
MTVAPVHLVRGDDPVLRADATSALIDELLEGSDRSLALDDLEVPGRARRDDAPQGDDDETEAADVSILERILVALSSPPFLVERRVVVIRNIAGLSKDQVALVVDRLADPTPGVVAIVEHHGGRLPGEFEKFVKANKIVARLPKAEEVAAGSNKTSVVEVELQRRAIEAGLKLHTDARARIVKHLGDDGGRVAELVEILATRFPIGTTVRADEIEPYLGETGGIDRPFALTEALEKGDAARSLDVLHRLMHATSAKSDARHPMLLMATLVNYYRSLLRLDSPAIRTKDDAAAALGGNPWAAKYRLDASRALGSAGLREAFALLAQADLDLRGKRAIDEETVMQVLVARLAALHRRGATSRGRAGARG